MPRKECWLVVPDREPDLGSEQSLAGLAAGLVSETVPTTTIAVIAATIEKPREAAVSEWNTMISPSFG
jgi:hypothetical protein